MLCGVAGGHAVLVTRLVLLRRLLSPQLRGQQVCREQLPAARVVQPALVCYVHLLATGEATWATGHKESDLCQRCAIRARSAHCVSRIEKVQVHEQR